MKIQDKTVFVSGANRGIGRALVEELLKNDVKKIYASARKLSSLPDWKDARIVPVELDITDDKLVSEAARKAIDVDLLINNSGVASFSSILSGPLENVQRDMDTNYYGTLKMLRAFIPNLKKVESPAIVNVVTIGAFVNFPILGGYCASKSALFSLSQAARIELASEGISVHTVNPGPIDTDMAKEFDTEKAPPAETAKNIIDELQNDTADIFPDAGGQGMFEVWKKDYRELEKMVSQM